MDKDLEYRLLKIETFLEDIYDTVIKEFKQCTICKQSIKLFLPYGTKYRKNSCCPVCGSLERHRTIWKVIEKESIFRNENLKMLHFAPEKVLAEKFKKMSNITYYPVDFNENYPGIVKKVDITNITFEDGYFDLVVCNHVLEHIEDDIKAMKELYRVLKTGGIVYITVPLDLTSLKTFENFAYNTPELRLKYFKQEDHVRIYSLDIAERLKSVGFDVNTLRPNIDCSDHEIWKYGIEKNEIIFKCVKNML